VARNKFRYSDRCHSGVAELVLRRMQEESRRPSQCGAKQVSLLHYQLLSKVIAFKVVYHRIALPDVGQELFTVLAQIVSIARKWILSQRLVNIF
jgi:hypothetical protein